MNNGLPTRGSWIAQSAPFGFGIWSEIEKENPLTPPLAMVLNTSPSCEANAKLIAAIPDITKALIDASKLIMLLPKRDLSMHQTEVNHILQTLIKALG